jgi:Pyruvate/2-oxoacid:ferredoxin oxidoreductase delta subunit
MTKIPTPMDRRRFMKHVGILGLAGVMGMSIGEIFSPSESDLVDAAADAEISKRRKMIWDTKAEALARIPPGPSEEVPELKSGGFPRVYEGACAYHLPNPRTGEYEDITEDNEQDYQFCKGPCVDVCPVDSIRLRKRVNNRTMSGFPQKNKDTDTDEDRDFGDPREITGCIGCQKCFKICGYDAIEWVNSE